MIISAKVYTKLVLKSSQANIFKQIREILALVKREEMKLLKKIEITIKVSLILLKS